MTTCITIFSHMAWIRRHHRKMMWSRAMKSTALYFNTFGAIEAAGVGGGLSGGGPT